MKNKKEILKEPNTKLLQDGADGMAFTWISWLVIVSDGGGWEHVSISNKDRKTIPSWQVMRDLKRLVFKDDEVVMQLHPAEKSYVTPGTDMPVNSVEVLHLWRPIDMDIPLPPIEFV